MRTSELIRICRDPRTRSGLGYVAKAEALIAQYMKAGYAVLVSSATEGLAAVFDIFDLSSGEVAGPDLTWGGTYAGLLRMGGMIRLSAVDSETLTLCPIALDRVITADTRAIVSVDAVGIPADHEALRRLADRHGLVWIADASSSLGARRGQTPASASADARVISFGLGKPVSLGGGGAVLTDRLDIYEELIKHTQHPDRQRRELHHTPERRRSFDVTNEFARNLQVHPLAARLLVDTWESQLSAVQERQVAGRRLENLINETGLARALPPNPDVVPSYAGGVLLRWIERPAPRALRERLSSQGVQTQVVLLPYRMVHEQLAFRAQFSEPDHVTSIDVSEYALVNWREETAGKPPVSEAPSSHLLSVRDESTSTVHLAS